MRKLALLTLLLAVAPAPAAAQIRLTVTSEDDTDDGLCDAGHCSLREAIDSANVLAGTDTIAFDIPGAGGFRDIRPGAVLPALTDPVVIDGTTQPEFDDEPVVRIDGSLTGVAVDGLVVDAAGSTIRGLVIHSFADGIVLNSGSNRIEGNIVGGTLRTPVCEGNSGSGIAVTGSANTIGGVAATESNVVVCSGGDGILISGADNVVRGNSIGVENPARVESPGTTDFSNAGNGVRIAGATGNTIGGTGPLQANAIARNGTAGVSITGTGSTGNAVTGNVIALNDAEGIVLPDAGTGNRIDANRIFDNGGLGIDLGADGITLNDPNDGDQGPNGLQNFPVIASVVVGSSDVFINGTFSSTPSADFVLEFFGNESCDASNNGEGDVPLATLDVTTGTGGDATFVATASDVQPGDYVTATARSADGSTSEFSACARATAFSVTIQPDSVTVNRGASARYAISLEPVGGPFTARIGLSCDDVPALTECTFEPDTLIPGADTATSFLTLSTTLTVSENVVPVGRAGLGGGLALAVPVLVLLALIALRADRRRRKVAVGLAVAAIVAGAALQAGCGDDGTGPTAGGTPVGRHLFVVQAGSEQLTIFATGILVVTP